MTVGNLSVTIIYATEDNRMQYYQHVLLAIDFYGTNQQVIDKAKCVTDKYRATLSLVHVVDNLPFADAVYDSYPPYTLDLTAAIVGDAKKKTGSSSQRIGRL